MEAELEEERRQRQLASNARKKVEGDFRAMEEQLADALKIKDEAIKQFKRLQVIELIEP